MPTTVFYSLQLQNNQDRCSTPIRATETFQSSCPLGGTESLRNKTEANEEEFIISRNEISFSRVNEITINQSRWIKGKALCSIHVFFLSVMKLPDIIVIFFCVCVEFLQLYCSVSVRDGRPVCHEVRASHREALWLRQRSQLQLLPAQVHLKLRPCFCLPQDRASSADSSQTSTLTSLTSSC